jgi:predicted membrane protein (TIGR00267 family)
MEGSTSRGDYAFALVIGLVDGILTALILAAGKVVESKAAIHFDDVIRVAIVASISAAFTFFVAQYSRFRHELVHAEKHLTLGSRGRLAKTQLGRAVLLESIVGSVVSGSCSFIGAMFPLLFATIWSGLSWLSIGAALVVLGLLGAILGRSAYGNAILWAIGLMSVGVVLTFVGLKLHIV